MAPAQYESVEVPHEDRYYIERLFPSDLRREGIIPASLLHHAELAALEAERVRLAAALDEAEQGGGRFSDALYLQEQTRALREGTELPPRPPTAAERQDAEENRNRDTHAASEALVLWGRTLYQTLAAHPEWKREEAEKVSTARAEADAARRAAEEADARAVEAEAYTLWLTHASQGNVYFPTFVKSGGLLQDDSDIVWNVTDPHILGLIAASRSGQAI